MTMKEFFSSQLFLLAFTVGVYLGCVRLYRKTGLRILHPLLVSIGAIIASLRILGVDYATYRSATQPIDFMLGVSVVALGYLLYEQMEHLRGRMVTILVSVAVGAVVGIGSVVVAARLMGADNATVLSLQPKSITTPIAVSVSEAAGGIPALTAVVVVLVGILGSIVGPFVLDRAGVTDKIARGLAMGSASHAIGTARAIELGAIEGAISGLAMGLMGVVTAILIPIFNRLFF